MLQKLLAMIVGTHCVMIHFPKAGARNPTATVTEDRELTPEHKAELLMPTKEQTTNNMEKHQRLNILQCVTG